MKNLINIRRVIALLFVAFLIFIGIKFYYFVKFYETGQGFFVERPPSVEAFLPISALMALRQLLELKVWDYIHPAGLVIFIAVLVTSLLFRRFFCSFICPIGTLSDWLNVVGKKLFKKNFHPPKWLDFVLGGLKFVLLAFFLNAVLISMDIYAVSSFLQAPYNKIADIKMMYFFINLSQTALIVIALLVIASLFIPFFWCRYLCPYGALLAVFSKFSPTFIKRDTTHCIDCKKCDAVCPSGIPVSSKDSVKNSSCISCFSCVEACPKADALNMNLFNNKINMANFSLVALAVFYAFIIWAMVSGHWQTNITPEEWQRLVPLARQFGH